MSFDSKVTLVTLSNYSQNTLPQQLAAGDFNGDGVTDFVLTKTVGNGTAPTTFNFLIGDSNHIWSDQTSSLFNGSVPTSIYAPRVAVADFNSDGKSDVYLPDFGQDGGSFTGNQDHLWLSQAGGTMYDASSMLSTAKTLAHGVSVGDINKDGKLDIVVDNLASGSAEYSNSDFILINQGNGQFSEQSSSLLPAAFRYGASGRYSHTWSGLVDLNNDGYPDLILGTWDGAVWNAAVQPASQVLFNDGTGSFANSSTYFLPHSPIDKEIIVAIQGGDLNGDGLQDLVLSVTNGGDSSSFYTKGYLQFLVNQGNGQFVDETATRFQQDSNANGPWWKFIKSVDMNGDGAQDLVLIGEGNTWQSGTVAKVILNDGYGNFSTAYTLSFNDAQTAAVEVTDVNGDSKPDLLAFKWTSSTSGEIDAYLNDLPGVRIEGTATSDNIAGRKYNDLILPMTGNDTIDGGAGIDTVILPGIKSGYTIKTNSSGATVTGQNVNDTLTNVERLQFSDKTVAVDINGNAGQSYRVYQAAFDRKPDNGGLKYWIDVMDKGASLDTVASGFIASQEFQSLYGANPTVEQFVTKLYNNVLHRAPEQAGYDYWVGLLNNNTITEAQALVNFSESAENQAGVIGVIQDGIELF